LTGVGACNGDSGGGFALKKEGRWYLRGLVSFGKTTKKVKDGKEVKICESKIPSLYVDLAAHMDWIVEHVSDSK
jgi:secreted trypsin-like serine protease